MYCVNCGVQLADSEKTCPLCGVACYHPAISRPEGERLYPANRDPIPQVSPWGVLIVITVLFLMPLVITLLCDLQINGSVTWSGFVSGALLLAYVIIVLPCWFRRPNPVIFVSCDFLVIGLYVLYIDLVTGGDWFLSLAFPVVGFFGLLTTAVVTLLRYVRRGRLYVFGGAFLALGLFMPVMELLILQTFRLNRFIGWSIYPLAALGLLGALLIFLAICKPARESMTRKFFL